jgi:hypothetical protein
MAVQVLVGGLPYSGFPLRAPPELTHVKTAIITMPRPLFLVPYSYSGPGGAELRGLRMQFQAERPNDFQHRGEFRIALRG